MDISILLDEFCFHAEHIRGVSPRTIVTYRENLRYLAQSRSATVLSQLDRNYVYAFFMTGRMTRNWKASTYRRYHMTFKVFFDWCIRRGYLRENPVKDVEIPPLKKSLPKKLSKQDAIKLLESIRHMPYAHSFLRYRNHAIFATFLFAGLRKRELLNLKLGDVDLDNHTILVRSGKGGKDRFIPMSYRLAQILKRYNDERRSLCPACPEFFISRNRDRGLTQWGLKHCTEQIKHETKIEFTIHRLRHTFATLMLEGGCDIFSLSKLLGHSDISTTTIYLSASAEHLRGQMVKHPLNQ